ncbi:MAG TPA: hypothetical protein VLB02_01780 [Candidatus Paceibacterota bacterium]|nr:hypothetical protein [Candidatus Paceibacterota bacterium]
MIKQIIGSQFPGSMIIDTNITEVHALINQQQEQRMFFRSIQKILFPVEKNPLESWLATNPDTMQIFLRGNGVSITTNDLVAITMLEIAIFEPGSQEVFGIIYGSENEISYHKKKDGDKDFGDIDDIPVHFKHLGKLLVKVLHENGVILS